MAEIIERGKKTGKLSTRVDLTPMVDLGFLLITFFIFTTALTKPTSLKIYLPESVNNKDRMPTPVSGVVTILIGPEKQVYCYEGDDPYQMHSVEFNSVRQTIIDKKRKTKPDKFMVIIKPGKDSNFQSLVKMMDEMTINEVKHYAMVDIDPIEYSLMHQKLY